MVRKNSKISKEARLDWLLDRVCELEIERDEAIERAQAAELDNMRLRIKLNAVRDIVLREDFLGTDDNSDDNGGTPAAEKADVPALDEQQIKTYKDEERELDDFLADCEEIRAAAEIYTPKVFGDDLETEQFYNELY